MGQGDGMEESGGFGGGDEEEENPELDYSF